MRRTSPRLRKRAPPTAAAAAPPKKKRRTGDSKKCESTSCAICISEVTDEEPATINGCDHEFCFDCIKQWSSTENSCPLCKARFTEIHQGDTKHEVAKRDQKSDASIALEGLLASLGSHPRFGRLFASTRFRRSDLLGGRGLGAESDETEDDDDDDDPFLPGFMNVILRTTVSTTTHHVAFGAPGATPPAPRAPPRHYHHLHASGGNTAATAIDLADSDDDDDVEVVQVTRSL